MAASRAKLPFSVNGEALEVPGISHSRCKKCDEVVLDLDAADRLQEQAFAMYRSRHGLMTPQEILQLRKDLGVTQTKLGQLLQLGNNTISRWETGRTVQTGSLDTLLRILRDVPGTVEYLAQRVA